MKKISVVIKYTILIILILSIPYIEKALAQFYPSN